MTIFYILKNLFDKYIENNKRRNNYPLMSLK